MTELIDILDSTDKQLLIMMNGDCGAFADAFWRIVSYKWTWMLVAIGIAVDAFCIRKSWKVWLLQLLTVAVILSLCDYMASGLLKHIVARIRPSHDEAISGMLHYVGTYRAGLHGFVSSHASNSMGLVVWFGYLFRHKGLWALLALWVVVHCYSRIYLGVHYPGDILCGAILGTLIAIAVIALCRRLARRIPLMQKTLEPVHRLPYATLATLAVTIVYIIIRSLYT